MEKEINSKKIDCPHVGELVNYTIYQMRIQKKQIAELVGVQKLTISRAIKKPSFQLDLLWQISQFTRYNFLAHLGEKLEIPYETKTEKLLKEQLLQKEKELADLQKEKELLMQVLGK